MLDCLQILARPSGELVDVLGGPEELGQVLEGLGCRAVAFCL